jgi:RNA polymerase sigma-70 factor (ECF subfamily)
MVILRYFSELTVPEIASVTGIREGTVKSRLSRALNHLGEILRNEEETGEVKR